MTCNTRVQYYYSSPLLTLFPTMNSTLSRSSVYDVIPHVEVPKSFFSSFLYFEISISFLFLVLIARKISWRRHPFYHDSQAPPVVPYYIPFFGVTASFWTDMLGFFRKWRKNYETDIFGGYMGGKPFYFICDPLASAHLVSGRISSLSWVEAKYRMLKNGLGGSHEAAHTWITRADLKTEHSVVEKYLQNGTNLNNAVFKYQEVLENDILPNLMKIEKEGEWQKGGMMNIIGKSIFYGNIDTMFGYKSLRNDVDYEITMIFERRFPIFTGISFQLVQMRDWKGYSARENHIKKMKGIFSKLLNPSYSPSSKDDDFFSDLVREYGELAYKNMELDDIARFHYLFFVASYFNTIPAGFWAVFEMLRDPKAYEACRKEVFAAKIAKEKEIESTGDASNNKYFTLDDLEKMDVLESLIMEAMRLRSTTKTLRLRYANEDFHLKLPLPLSGKVAEFDVKKGTYFVSCPTLMHQDPDIFEDPLTFKFDRFAKNADGKSPVFTKNGKRIHRPVDAFGGGLTMCPGRKFATAAIKSVIVDLILNYDLRFPDEKIPDPPLDKWGIVNTGMPVHDVVFEFRKRKSL